LVVVFPYSISKSLHIQSLHVLIILLVIFTVVVLLHLLLLLLRLHLGGLVVVHLIIHVVAFGPDHRVLLVKLIQQLHENLVVVVKSFGLDFLSPTFIVRLDIVEDCINKYANIRVLVRQ